MADSPSQAEQFVLGCHLSATAQIRAQPLRQRAFGHVQETQRIAKGIFDDRTAADGNREWCNQRATAAARQGVDRCIHVVHQIVDARSCRQRGSVCQHDFRISFRQSGT